MACKSLILANSTHYCEHEKQPCFYKADVLSAKWGLRDSMANYRFWLCLHRAQTREENTKNSSQTWTFFEKRRHKLLLILNAITKHTWLKCFFLYRCHFYEREKHLIRILQSLNATVITNISRDERIRFLSILYIIKRCLHSLKIDDSLTFSSNMYQILRCQGLLNLLVIQEWTEQNLSSPGA